MDSSGSLGSAIVSVVFFTMPTRDLLHFVYMKRLYVQEV